MAIKLGVKQSANLTLNPVIHSFISFLALSRTEFSDRINNEVDSNPMLEVEEIVPVESGEKDVNVLQEKMEMADSSFLNSYEENGFFKRDESSIDKNRAIELFSTYKETLADHLLHQAEAVFDEKDMELASYIVYNLNECGYLEVEVESVASVLETTPERLDSIRNTIKTFDPRGTASMNLEECLLSQIDEDNFLLKELIENHLEDLSKSRYKVIEDAMGLSHEQMADLSSQVKRLNPKPGLLYESEDIDYAEVDLMLIKENNEYKIAYIEEGMPRLKLSGYYEDMLKRTEDRESKSYLKERSRGAQLFIDGIELRTKMIVRIAEYLVKVQKDFLDFGYKWKKPLTMKEVARELGYSESTISRAVSNKFMASEKGLIKLKSFFTHGIKGEFGFTHSVETIKDKIKALIEEEPHKKPLSDQELSVRLGKLGIKISRRTIRNYRDEMKIPSSTVRRQEYSLRAGGNN